MKVLEAEFLTSAARAADVPAHAAPQLALVGRSNVGKSSLINALTRRRVARTSATPGKTRLVNLYRVVLAGGRGKSWTIYLADVPGYGFARAPRQARGAGSGPTGGRAQGRAELGRLATEYFGAAPPAAVLLIVDARHPGLDADLEAWRWLASLGLAAAVVATKCDKLGRAELTRALGRIERECNSDVTAVSAETGAGMDDLWRRIATLVTDRREATGGTGTAGATAGRPR